MDRNILKNYIENGLSIRKICKIEKSSYSTIRYWLDKYSLKTNYKHEIKRIWDDNDLKESVKNRNTIADVLRDLKLVVRPGDHFTGRSEKHRNRVYKIDLDKILIKNSTYRNNTYLKNRLLKENLLKNICYKCKSTPIWNDKPLTLVLDHINGINNDNEINNLRLLCPNCNSQEPTFCIGNKGM